MAYRALVQGGMLRPDPAQQLAIERLQSLYRALLHYQPETGRRGWLARFGLIESGGGDAPVGLYLCGPVGRGNLSQRVARLVQPDLAIDDVLDPEFRDRERDAWLQQGAVIEFSAVTPTTFKNLRISMLKRSSFIVFSFARP